MRCVQAVGKVPGQLLAVVANRGAGGDRNEFAGLAEGGHGEQVSDTDSASTAVARGVLPGDVPGERGEPVPVL